MTTFEGSNTAESEKREAFERNFMTKSPINQNLPNVGGRGSVKKSSQTFSPFLPPAGFPLVQGMRFVIFPFLQCESLEQGTTALNKANGPLPNFDIGVQAPPNYRPPFQILTRV